MQISDYASSLIAPLLRHADALKVVETQDKMGILLTIAVHKEDMGVLIGKSGATAGAIRQLVKIVGMKENARVSCKFNEPDGSTYTPKS